jgi:hypothetical protein
VSLYIVCLVIADTLLRKLVLETAVSPHTVYPAIADTLWAQIELLRWPFAVRQWLVHCAADTNYTQLIHQTRRVPSK